MTHWTEEFRDQFQHDTLYGKQISYCGLGRSAKVMDDPIAYPKFAEPYAPIDECAMRRTYGTGNRQAVMPFSLNFIACILVSCGVKKLWI